MPEALATSKRKFYKFLDNLSAPPKSVHAKHTDVSSNPRASIVSTLEPSAKRIRPTVSSTTLASIHARNTSNVSLASVKSTTKPAGPPREAPNFSPWSHEAFLKRLHTFSPVTLWHPKPDAVNEVEWAKRGWSCVDTNTVGCKGGCGKRVVVKVEPHVRQYQGESQEEGHEGEDAEAEEEEDFAESFEAALVNKYKVLIIEGHSESCLWRQAGCKNDIYRLPIVRSAVWQSEVRDRYVSLLGMEKDISNLQIKLLDAKPEPEKLLEDLPSSLLQPPPEDKENAGGESAQSTSLDSNPETRSRALQISLCGWKGTTESNTALFSCDACFQRIGLWMYQADYKRPGHAQADDEEDQDEDASSLDLVEMHREHCPWRNASSQCATGDYAGLPAWRIMWTIIARYAETQRRRSRDQMSTTPAAHPFPGDGRIDDTITADDAGEVEMGELLEMPQISREESQRVDKERITKLRKLKQALGFKRKVPSS